MCVCVCVCMFLYVWMLLSARECVQASMRACVQACVRAYSYCAHEVVFQSVFEKVYVCFCLPVLNTVSVFFLDFLRVFINVCACVCVCVCVCGLACFYCVIELVFVHCSGCFSVTF